MLQSEVVDRLIPMFAANLRRALISLVFVTGASLLPPAWSAVEGSRVEITVNGMVCSYCAQGIERNLRRLSLTQAVAVDLKQHRVTISVKPGAVVDDQQIRKAIRDSGFDVREIRTIKSAP
jgi:copper chaperone CopZ